LKSPGGIKDSQQMARIIRRTADRREYKTVKHTISHFIFLKHRETQNTQKIMEIKVNILRCFGFMKISRD